MNLRLYGFRNTAIGLFFWTSFACIYISILLDSISVSSMSPEVEGQHGRRGLPVMFHWFSLFGGGYRALFSAKRWSLHPYRMYFEFWLLFGFKMLRNVSQYSRMHQALGTEEESARVLRICKRKIKLINHIVLWFGWLIPWCLLWLLLCRYIDFKHIYKVF